MKRVCRLAVNAADHLVAKKRLDAAASILENYLSAYEEHPDVLRRLGRIRLAQGRPKDAAPLLERALHCYTAANQAPDPAPVEMPDFTATATLAD